jgi:hypothetical protein
VTLAWLEALADPRLDAAPAAGAGVLAGLREAGLLDAAGRPNEEGLGQVEAAARGRAVRWGTREVAQGEVLDEFAEYCDAELDDVDVLERGPVRVLLGWRRERSAIELRVGTVLLERLAGDDPLLLLTAVDETLASRFVDDANLRTRVAVLDLDRLEKINAVRSSVFVHFEWFLRDVYGVKVLPADAFTRGLVERGIISLGMG